MEIINFGAKKVLLLSALFTFSMMNVIPSSECSTQQEVPLAFDKMTFGNDNTTQDENGGSLGTILQDLDRCIEIRAKLNHTDYLTACLETELSSIIFNVMEKNEGDMNAESENRTETFGNPFEEPILEKNLTPTRAHAESVQISEIKERLKMENSNSGAKLSGREVKKHDSFSIGMNRDATARNRSPPLKYTFLQGRRRGSTVKRDLSDVEKISKKPLDNEADQIQLKINNLKQPLNVDISESEMRTAFKETQKGELSEDTALESAPQRDISENVNDLKSSDQHLNDIPDAALDFKTEIKNLWRQNNIKTLRELLETAKVHLEMLGLDSNTGLLKHKFNQTEGKTTDTIDQIGTTSMVSDGIYNKPSSPFHSNHNVHLRRPKQYNLERKRESLMDMVKTLVRDVFRWKIVTYGLDKVREYSRSLNDFGAAQIMWNILRTGYVIATSGRKKDDNKPQVMSGLILLGVMIPTLFSVVALMAKKALISSLVALALSFYAVTHSKGGNIKQNYEVEGPYAAAAKYSEFKSNSGATGNIEFPNIQSIPIPNGANSPYTQKSQASFPHDDTKYFSRPPKQQESESMTYKNVEPFDYSYKYRVRKPQESRGPTDYHEYNVQNTPESNSYEVTERNDIKYRRPSHANENRYKYVADEEENSHAVTEPFRPITYDDSEERYSHSNYPSRQPHEETTRHGKGKDYQTGGYATQHERGSNSPKYNSYKNSNSYRADTKRLKINRERTEGLDQNVASSERNLKTNKNYSSKFAKDHLKHPSDTTSSELKYTAELEPTVSTENLVKQVPRTEINVYTNQIHSTVASDNDHSEDVFKPIIVTTPASKYKILNRQTHQAPDKVKNSNQTRNQTQSTQYVNEEDIILYQNLDEHEFKRPSPIYQPTDSESHKNSRNELTLTYVPKIKSVSNNTEISEFKR